MEDYQLCEANDVGPALAPIDDEGRFTAEAFHSGGHNKLLKGLDVQTEGVKAVLEVLRDSTKYLPPGLQVPEGNLVFATHEFTHKNPIDWRTKQPVIVRATAQWFADVSAIKDRALKALDDVTFIPESGKTRLRSFVEGRSQWCISRQRSWGVPIPALYHRETGEACIREESINHIIEIIKQKGTDAWFSDAPDDPSWIHPSLAEDPWVRGKDTMDVWFDSGTTWTTLSPKDGQALSDVYLEGTDQHRGWFQSSLLTHIATQHSIQKDYIPTAPFRTLITHGFTLDAEGKKMSKSLGNVISPDQILDGSLLPPLKAKKQRGNKKESASSIDGPKYDSMGPDVLRLWVASSDYTRDVSVSVSVLQSVQQALQKLRVTFKFLLGVLGDYVPQSDLAKALVNVNARSFADRAILHRLSQTSQSVWNAYEEYKFYKAVSDVNSFVSSDLSAFYFEIVKDAAYAGSKVERTRTQGVLATILEEMMKMLGPITPHLIEEVWEHFPAGMKTSNEHPLKQVWEGPYVAPQRKFYGQEMDQQIEGFQHLSAAVKIAQEEARNAGRLRSGLACDVVVLLLDPMPTPGEILHGRDIDTWTQANELANLLVVSRTVVTSNQKDYKAATKAEWKYEQEFEGPNEQGGKVAVLPPKKQKCVRCWKYTAEEGDEPCQRCRDALEELTWG
jgi:isoleucyl-tRNA synthetase